MKICSINSAFNRVNLSKQQAKNQNFAGLWGKEETIVKDETRYDWGQNIDYGTYYQTTEKPYYPFLDETEADIEKIKKENSEHSYSSPSGDPSNIDQTSREYNTIVKVMPKIPVTAAEYNAYTARELLSKQELVVEDKLKGAGLQKFLNVPPKKNV